MKIFIPRMYQKDIFRINYQKLKEKGYKLIIFNLDNTIGTIDTEECDLKTTTIKLPQEFINNPEEYCSSEFVNSIVKRNEMVIIGSPKEEGNNIIIETDSKWIGDQELKYLIRSENILGYIDLETLDIIYNQDYIDFNFRR